MPTFIVSTIAHNGDHEVHNEEVNCKHSPPIENRRRLGWFSSEKMALDEAKKTFAKVKACGECT